MEVDLDPKTKSFFDKTIANLQASGLKVRRVGTSPDHVSIDGIIKADMRKYPPPDAGALNGGPSNYNRRNDIELFLEQFPAVRLLRTKNKRPLPCDRPPRPRTQSVPFAEWIQQPAHILDWHLETGGEIAIVLGSLDLVVFDIDKGGIRTLHRWRDEFKTKNRKHFIVNSSRENRYHLYLTGQNYSKRQCPWGDVLGSKSYVIIYQLREVIAGIRWLKEPHIHG